MRGDRLQIREGLTILVQRHGVKTLVIAFKVPIRTHLECAQRTKIQIGAQGSLAQADAVGLLDRAVVARVIEILSGGKNIALLSNSALDRNIGCAMLRIGVGIHVSLIGFRNQHVTIRMKGFAGKDRLPGATVSAG